MQKKDDAFGVLLICGNPSTLDTLKASITSAPDLKILGETANFDRAADRISRLAPHVVVVDVSAAQNGAERIEALRSTFPHVHVIAISPQADPVYAERILRAGALGYLSGAASFPEVADAIRAVGRKKAYVSRDVARKLITRLMQSASEDHERHTHPS